MKNIDKYRELIEKEIQKESPLIGVFYGKPTNCAEIDSCAHCALYDSNDSTYQACAIDFIDWMFDEVE